LQRAIRYADGLKEGVIVNWLSVAAISIGLAMDAFAVSISTGLNHRLAPLQIVRLSSAFGFFQFAMPMIGWFLGRQVSMYVGAFDHWIAFGLLLFVGGKMLWESRGSAHSVEKADPTRGAMLLMLSLATSIDALSVGLSLAFLRVSILLPSLVIGIVTFSLSAIGAGFGSRIGRRWGVWAEVAGGCVLIYIGARILYSHLT
jgi:manganese efflux pump family protein